MFIGKCMRHQVIAAVKFEHIPNLASSVITQMTDNANLPDTLFNIADDALGVRTHGHKSLVRDSLLEYWPMYFGTVED